MSSERLRVFISYARRDAAAFAEELVAGLEVAGFEAFLDKHDIAGGEDWEARLGGLIESADTIVFVLSPASVASERCQWEVERASALSKRIVPVVLIPVEEAATPAPLRRLNYIFFGEGQSFSRSLGSLAQALRVDLDWIREHTRLGDVARRWDARQRNDVLLLRGPELEAARAWLAGWRTPAPEPTDLQRAFLAASEEAEGAIVKRERARQRRTIIGLVAVAVVFALSAVGASYLWFKAQASETRAMIAQRDAENAARSARLSEREARVTAARASLYEGLYWLKAGNEGGGDLQTDDWERALVAFERGLTVLGPDQARVENLNLRDVLDYGRRYVLLCAGFEATALNGYTPPEGLREYYSRIRMPNCASGNGRRRPRPNAPVMPP